MYRKEHLTLGQGVSVVKLIMLIEAMAHFALLALDQPKAIEARVRGVLSSERGVKYSHDQDTLVVKYKTHFIKVFPQSKSALKPDVKKELEEHPASTGFSLEVYEFPHGQNEPARPEQMVRMNPSWMRDYGSYKLDAVERQVDGKDMGRYYYIEWGNELDPKLIAKIRQALEQGTHPIKQ